MLLVLVPLLQHSARQRRLFQHAGSFMRQDKELVCMKRTSCRFGVFSETCFFEVSRAEEGVGYIEPEVLREAIWWVTLALAQLNRRKWRQDANILSW